MSTGDRITQLRKVMGWSQEELGSRVGVSRQAVSRWESDQAMPETETIIELSRIFDVSVGYMLGTEEKNETIQPAAEPVSLPAKKKSWIPLLTGILAAALVCAMIMRQNAQIKELQNSLYSLQNMYGNLSSQMDRMNSDLADTVEELLNNKQTVFAEYSLTMDSIDRDAGTFRIHLTGVLRNPAENVRFFARDSKDAIYTGTVEITEEQSGTVSGTVDVPLERGLRFYAGNGVETMHLTVRNLDLYDFTKLGASVEGYGVEAVNKNHVTVSISTGPPYVMDEQDKPTGVHGQLKVIQGDRTIYDLELKERAGVETYPNTNILMSAEFDRTEPADDTEEYLLYAVITDDRGRQYEGYVAKIQIIRSGTSEMLIPVEVDPETGEIR